MGNNMTKIKTDLLLFQLQVSVFLYFKRYGFNPLKLRQDAKADHTSGEHRYDNHSLTQLSCYVFQRKLMIINGHTIGAGVWWSCFMS